MSSLEYELIGIRELKRAIERNPEVVKAEAQKFMVRGLKAYRSGIINNPWKVGMRGGGAPVDTQNLRDTHKTEVGTFKSVIKPTAPYAEFVHEGTKKMKKRPWLDWVKRNMDDEVKKALSDIINSH